MRCLKQTRNDGNSDRELFFIEWLKREAQKIGEKLPHGDSLFKSDAETLLSDCKVKFCLPFPKKEVVHHLYTEFVNQSSFLNDIQPIS
jgi:hypothetical protein